MSFTSVAHAETWLTEFDLTAIQYQQAHLANIGLGYRPVYVSVHETNAGPRYQGAWVNDGLTAWALSFNRKWDDYQVFANAQSALNRRPLCISCYGFFPNERYSAVWVDDGVGPWVSQQRMTASQYESQLIALRATGYRPYWVSALTVEASDTLFSAIWIGDAHPQCDQTNASGTQFIDVLNSYRFGGCRLRSACGYGDPANPLFSGAWVYWEHPPYEFFHAQTLAEIQATSAQYLALGYRPTFTSAYETTAGTRYISAWQEIPEPKVFTTTGIDVPELAAFDATMQQFMIDRHVPNGSLAVTKDGRLVLARGYTYAEAGWPVTKPHSVFRLASLTKTITAVGVMKLVENGVIGIDEPISTILNTTNWVDPRINSVTIRQLLQHRGGWDVAALGFDPVYRDFEIAAALGITLPTTLQTIFDYMATYPITNVPGDQYAYCNFGYCILGLVIEAVTGQPYEQWMRSNIVLPIQANSIRTTDVLLGQQWPGEVTYWDSYQRTAPCVMGPTAPAITPLTYGGWNIRSLKTCGGQVSSAVDIARFISAFDDPTSCPLLSEQTIDLMWSRPPGVSPGVSNYPAAGWFIASLPDDLLSASGTGSINGSASWFVRRYDGTDWVALFNCNDTAGVPSISDIGEIMEAVASSITTFPTHDLFPQYTTPDLVTFVNVLLGTDTDPIHIEVCDANFDSAVDARDIGPFMKLSMP